MFANGPGDRGSNSKSSHTKDSKMVLDATLLSFLHYMVRIKIKWSNPEKGVCPLLHLGVVAIEKGAFGSPSTKVTNFTYINRKKNQR